MPHRFFISSRWTFWKSAIDIIQKFPFGIGLNTYTKVSKEYIYWWNGYPHNCYLQLIAEMGFMGFFAFGWIMIILFWRSIRSISDIVDPYLKSVLIGSLVGLFGFLVHSAFDTNLYSTQLGNLMWVIMGVIVAIQKINDGQASVTSHG